VDRQSGRCRSSLGSVGEDFLALGPGVFPEQIAHHGSVTVRRAGPMVGAAGHPKSRWLSAGRALPAIVVVITAGCSSSAGHSTAPTTTSSSTTALSSISTARTAATPVSIALTPIASSPSCDRATKDGTADALLSAFRAARVGGSGAEHCLTAQALGAYCTASHPCSQ